MNSFSNKAFLRSLLPPGNGAMPPVSDQPGTGQPGTGQPGTGQPGTDQHVIQLDMSAPDVSAPDMSVPDVSVSDVSAPARSVPSMLEHAGSGNRHVSFVPFFPGPGQPGPGQLGTGQPGPGQPYVTQTSVESPVASNYDYRNLSLVANVPMMLAAASPNRASLFIQNNGTDSVYIQFGSGSPNPVGLVLGQGVVLEFDSSTPPPANTVWAYFAGAAGATVPITIIESTRPPTQTKTIIPVTGNPVSVNPVTGNPVSGPVQTPRPIRISNPVPVNTGYTSPVFRNLLDLFRVKYF